MFKYKWQSWLHSSEIERPTVHENLTLKETKVIQGTKIILKNSLNKNVRNI